MGKTFKDKKQKYQSNNEDAFYLKPKQKYKKTKQYFQHQNQEVEDDLIIEIPKVKEDIVEDKSELK